MTEKIYSAFLLKSRKYILFINTYILLGFTLTGLIAWHFHSHVTIITGGVLFFLLPLLIKRHIMHQFSALRTFRFSTDSIIISSAGEQKLAENLYEINLQDIKSYKYEDRAGFGNPYLILYQKSGKKISFDFEYTTGDEEFILAIILEHIRNYNLQTDAENAITIRRPFIATKYGLIFMILLGIGWACICLVLATKHTKTIPFSLIGGIGMFIQTFILRNHAIKSYKEQMEHLQAIPENHNP